MLLSCRIWSHQDENIFALMATASRLKSLEGNRLTPRGSLSGRAMKLSRRPIASTACFIAFAAAAQRLGHIANAERIREASELAAEKSFTRRAHLWKRDSPP